MQFTPSEIAFLSAAIAGIGAFVTKYGPVLFRWATALQKQKADEAEMTWDEHERVCVARISTINTRLNNIERHESEAHGELQELRKEMMENHVSLMRAITGV